VSDDPKRCAVFLDRDGTLIDTDVRDGLPIAISEPARLQVLDGVKEGCELLSDAGFALVLVTNQPDVARGKAARADVELMNSTLSARLGLDAAMTCYHDDVDNCDCRKPLPGLLRSASAQFGVSLDRHSFIIGDRWRDIGAGRAAGVTTVLIERGYAEPTPEPADHTAMSFSLAVEWILNSRSSDSRDDGR
jgi:D-glycero-D-manno-heptose 1,7-bisphosphate phosphatase